MFSKTILRKWYLRTILKLIHMAMFGNSSQEKFFVFENKKVKNTFGFQLFLEQVIENCSEEEGVF